MARLADGMIRLNQQTKAVESVEAISIDNEVVFAYFDSIAQSDYDATFERALALGCYALSQESIAQMLDVTARDLDGRLEQMKLLFQLRDLKQRSAAKGADAEDDIADVLQQISDARGWGDVVTATGNSIGVIARRKVGDFVIAIDGAERRIVVEAKWDSSVQPGHPSEATKPGSTPAKLEKTAYGQNITALANREADIAIFVGDVGNASAGLNKQGRLVFLPEQPGFNVLVDRSNGDWSLLEATYALARTLILAESRTEDAYRAVDFAVKRLQGDLVRLDELQSLMDTVTKSAQAILTATESYAGQREAIKASLATTAAFLNGWTEAHPNSLQKRDAFLNLNDGPSAE